MENFLRMPSDIDKKSEFFQTVLTGDAGLLVERIVSHGQTTPEGEWYDQERDEWVLLLEGEAGLALPDGSEANLVRGDFVFLPKHFKHRVSRTSSPCIWLAVHGNDLKANLPDSVVFGRPSVKQSTQAQCQEKK